jgi:hypothetical protein
MRSRLFGCRNKDYDEISPFIGGLAFHDYESAVEEAMEGVELMFDRNKFKADKQVAYSSSSLTRVFLFCSSVVFCQLSF